MCLLEEGTVEGTGWEGIGGGGREEGDALSENSREDEDQPGKTKTERINSIGCPRPWPVDHDKNSVETAWGGGKQRVQKNEWANMIVGGIAG